MREPAPGNRLVVGPSGIVFEIRDTVASGLVDGGDVRYVDEAGAPEPAARPQARRRAAK